MLLQILPDVLWWGELGLCSANVAEDPQLAAALQVLPLDAVTVGGDYQPDPRHHGGLALHILLPHCGSHLQDCGVHRVSYMLLSSFILYNVTLAIMVGWLSIFSFLIAAVIYKIVEYIG